MKISALKSNSTRAFTKLELVVVIVVILVMLSMLIPALLHPRAVSSHISCVSNLKQVGISFRLFATDHYDKFPMMIFTNEGGSLEYVGTGETFRHFLVLSNELTLPKILICYADDSSRVDAQSSWNEFNSNENISYFLGLDTANSRNQMFLAGDRNLELEGKELSGVVNLGTTQTTQWSKHLHRHSGNIVTVDGSVQQLTTPYLRTALLNTGDLTNRVSIPD